MDPVTWAAFRDELSKLAKLSPEELAKLAEELEPASAKEQVPPAETTTE